MSADSITNVPAGRRPWLPMLALAALLGGVFFFRLGQDLPLRTHEALVAETARNMLLGRPATLDDGSQPSPWLVPNFNGGARLRKTPLEYWLVAGLSSLTGKVDEWTARLPSALAALGTALIVLALVRRREGRLASLAAAAALVTSAEFLICARSALSDMPLTFFCTASLAAVWMAVETGGGRRFAWLLVTGAAAGLAMLAKGPVPALVLPLPYGVAAAIMIRRLVRPKEPLETRGAEWGWTLCGILAAGILFLAIALPWPLYVWWQIPHAADIWRDESVDRSLGDYGHNEAVYFYLVRLPFLIAPWTIFFVHGLVLAVQRARREAAARQWQAFLGACLLCPFIGLSLCAGKQDHYILPVLPACAVYIAVSVRHWLEPASPQVERTGRRLIGGHAAAVFLIAVAGGVLYGMARGGWVAHGLPSPLPGPLAGGVLLLALLTAPGSALAFVCAYLGRLRWSLAILIATFAAAFLAASPTLIRATDRATIAADFARQVRRQVPADAPLFSLVGSNNTIVFYAERAIPILPGPESVRGEMTRGRPFYVIIAGKHMALLPGALPLTPIIRVEDPLRPGEGFRLFEWPGPFAPGSSPR